MSLSEDLRKVRKDKDSVEKEYQALNLKFKEYEE